MSKKFVLKRFPRAAIIRPGKFANAPDDPYTYISTKHVRESNGHYGGELIGKGFGAREAWADAAETIEKRERRPTRSTQRRA